MLIVSLWTRNKLLNIFPTELKWSLYPWTINSLSFRYLWYSSRGPIRSFPLESIFNGIGEFQKQGRFMCTFFLFNLKTLKMIFFQSFLYIFRLCWHKWSKLVERWRISHNFRYLRKSFFYIYSKLSKSVIFIKTKGCMKKFVVI